MATIRVLLGIVCLTALGSGAMPERGILNPPSATRNTLISIARSQIGVREATGCNDGPEVERYLRYTGNRKGDAWCAAFVSWAYGQAGLSQPRTAWSPALFPAGKRTLRPQPADVLGIYSLKLKRIAHAGLVERRQHNWVISIEGNTQSDGRREGDGVYRKRRHIRTIYQFANWQPIVPNPAPEIRKENRFTGQWNVGYVVITIILFLFWWSYRLRQA